MIKKMKLFLVCGLLAAASVSVHAEVYELWPFNGGSSSGTSPAESLPSKKFWQEKVRVNGTDLSMNIFLVDIPFDDAVAVLRKKFPDAVMAQNRNSFLLSQLQKDGLQKRILLLSLAGVNPTIQFTMDVPPHAKEAKQTDWPRKIPLLPGASHLFLMHFPERKADFASCLLPGMTKPQAVSEMATRLQAQGWTAASGEIAEPFRASGEVFFKEKPMEILLFSAATQKQGVMVTVYTRPLDKK